MGVFVGNAFTYAFTGILLFMTFSVGAQPGHASEGPLVVILSGKDNASYKQAAQAFENHLKENIANITFFHVNTLKGDGKDVVQIVEDIKTKNPFLIYTLGSRATRAAVENINDLPIVAGFILDDSRVKGAANATGVTLAHSLEVQLQWLERLLPNIGSVGILYNPQKNAERIKTLEKLARKKGLKLLAVKVEQHKDLPDALKKVAINADVLFGIPDKLVLSRNTAKPILLASYRNRIPFVGLSFKWVKAGALYALERDYEDIGTQCGEMAQKILQGAAVTTLPPEPPRKVIYALNRKTIENMNINMPNTLLSNAVKIFE